MNPTTIEDALGTMTPAQMLEAALVKSGLSVSKFAEDLMGRDPRTVRRWRAEDQGIPFQARRWLARYLGADV